MSNTITVLDPNAMWWVCWRINGDLCGRTFAPLKTADTIDVMEKSAAVYGRDNVWLERASAANEDGHANFWTEAEAVAAKDVHSRRCIHGVPLNVFCDKCEG